MNYTDSLQSELMAELRRIAENTIVEKRLGAELDALIEALGKKNQLEADDLQALQKVADLEYKKREVTEQINSARGKAVGFFHGSQLETVVTNVPLVLNVSGFEFKIWRNAIDKMYGAPVTIDIEPLKPIN